MFKLSSQNSESGLVVVEDEDFGLFFEFVETNFISVKVVDDYDLVFIKKDGAIKKVSILAR
jgi:hypothetical protein